jgi:hypothetical protein
MIFKNQVRTAKKTPQFTFTKIDLFTLFKEIIAVYSKNHNKPINFKYKFTNCSVGTYNYHSALKG